MNFYVIITVLKTNLFNCIFFQIMNKKMYNSLQNETNDV